MSSHLAHDQIFVPFGDDFNYMSAFQNYKNLDALIGYMNENFADRYHFIYSTPSKWVDAVAALDIKWPTKYDDMFPYSDHPDAFWTGYFTSRPNSKEFIRRGSHNLHATHNLYSEKMFDQKMNDTQLKEILSAKDAMMDIMSISQHHDAVAGTERPLVEADYTKKLSKAMEQNDQVYSDVLNERISSISGWETKNQWKECTQTNTTYVDCPIVQNMEDETFALVRNPAQVEVTTMKFAVPSYGGWSAEVMDLETQTFKPVESTYHCHKDHKYLFDMKSCFLHVEASAKPQQFAVVKLVKGAFQEPDMRELKHNDFIDNGDVKITFERVTEDLSGVRLAIQRKGEYDKEIMDIQIGYWDDWVKLIGDGGQHSGSYIFRPKRK